MFIYNPELSLDEHAIYAISKRKVKAHRRAPVRPPSTQPLPCSMTLRDNFALNTELCLDGRITRGSIYPTAAGGCADVYKGLYGNRQVAIKVVRPFGSGGKKMEQKKLLRRLWREYLAWHRLSHRNILACLGYSYDFSPDSYILPSLISPWMENGTLTLYIQNHPTVDRMELLTGVADALSYLHTRDPVIVHGDLRAGNILVSDRGVPCLTDFGLSRVFDEVRGVTTSTEFAGSVRWMSPELFKDDGSVSVYSDIWAYGMTILEVLSGERPYSAVKSDIIVLGKIKEGQLPPRPQDPKVLEVLSGRVWDTCHHCWSLEPTARSSIEEVASMMIPPMKCSSDPYTIDIARGHVLDVGFQKSQVENVSYEVSFCFSIDGQYIAVCHSRFIDLFDTSSGVKTHTIFRNRLDAISTMCFSPDGKFLVTGSWSGAIHILDVSSLKDKDKSNPIERELYTPQGRDHPRVSELVFCKDGRLLVSRHGGYGMEVWIWDTETYQQMVLSVRGPLEVYMQYEEWRTMAISPDGTLGAVSPDGRELYLWDLERGLVLERLPGSANISHVIFTPDGSGLLTYWAGYGATLWDLGPFLMNPERDTPLEPFGLTPSEATTGQGEKGSTPCCHLEFGQFLLRVVASRLVMTWFPCAFIFWDRDTGSEGDLRLDSALGKVINFDLSPTSGMLASVEQGGSSSITLWHYRFT